MKFEMLISIKIQYVNKFSFFSGTDKPRMHFLLLINVTMPTIVGIVTFMSKKISCSAELSKGNSFITLGPDATECNICCNNSLPL